MKYTSTGGGDGQVFTPPTLDLTPAYSPPPAPAPNSPSKYDGTYDFFFQYPSPGGLASSSLSRYLVIRNGVVSSSDGKISGTVDGSFGNIVFTSPCPINSSTADWKGIMNVSALGGSNFGQGTFTCRINIAGAYNWQATQSR